MSISVQQLENMLDKKFPGFKYRENQKEAILGILWTIANTKKKYIILDAPTGSGKSWIARQVAEIYNEMYDKSCLVLTKTIALQNQYTHDFPEIKKLMAASNFECHVDYPLPIPPNMKWHSGCKHTKHSGLCEYKKARDEYESSPLKTLNYAFLLSGVFKYNTDGLLICDEAHNLEESILDTFQTILDFNELLVEEFGGINFRSFLPNASRLTELSKHDIRAVVEYLNAIVVRLDSTLEELNNQLEDPKIDSKSIITLIESKIGPLEKKCSKYKNLRNILLLLETDDFNRWDIVYNKDKKYFTLKPIFVPESVSMALLNPPHKILFMSATADRIKESLKLPEDECQVFSLPYIFDLNNRPVYVFSDMPPLNKFSFNEAIGTYIETIDLLIDQYEPDTNILIHSVSYKNAELFKSSSRHASRVVIPTKDQVRDIKSVVGNGSIIISPSVTEGIDLADGLARVQIFMKTPWPFLGDTWVVKKKDYDEGWYEYKTMLTIIQGSGRGIRTSSDKADTFILDPSFKRLYWAVQDYTPDWFKKTIIFL